MLRLGDRGVWYAADALVIMSAPLAMDADGKRLGACYRLCLLRSSAGALAVVSTQKVNVALDICGHHTDGVHHH